MQQRAAALQRGQGLGPVLLAAALQVALGQDKGGIGVAVLLRFLQRAAQAVLVGPGPGRLAPAGVLGILLPAQPLLGGLALGGFPFLGGFAAGRFLRFGRLACGGCLRSGTGGARPFLLTAAALLPLLQDLLLLAAAFLRPGVLSDPGALGIPGQPLFLLPCQIAQQQAGPGTAGRHRLQFGEIGILPVRHRLIIPRHRTQIGMVGGIGGIQRQLQPVLGLEQPLFLPQRRAKSSRGPMP